MTDNTTDRIEQLERRRDELLESEAYAAGIIELLRGMVDGEAFDICEEFTEQRHSPVAPITTVRQERDEARAALERVMTGDFAEKITHAIECCGAVPRGDAEQGAAAILALIRDETGEGR